jgi:hypothetical protein
MVTIILDVFLNTPFPINKYYPNLVDNIYYEMKRHRNGYSVGASYESGYMKINTICDKSCSRICSILDYFAIPHSIYGDIVTTNICGDEFHNIIYQLGTRMIRDGIRSTRSRRYRVCLN